MAYKVYLPVGDGQAELKTKGVTLRIIEAGTNKPVGRLKITKTRVEWVPTGKWKKGPATHRKTWDQLFPLL